MALTDDQRLQIRDEEYFRHEVRKELASPKPPTTFIDKCSAFFETKAGFWVLTSVLAGLAATTYTSVQKYIDSNEIAKREAIERSRRDMDTVLKLGPMLTSDKRTQVDMALILLDGLAVDNALEGRVAGQVRSLVQGTLSAGLRKEATPEEKQQADAIIAFADRARVAAVQQPEAKAAEAPVPSSLDAAALPARVYIQIGGEEDRVRADAMRDVFRKAGLIAAGIESVPRQSVPKDNDFRYCKDKVDQEALNRVQAVINAVVIPAPKALVLAPRLCGNVRFNHFELWLARRVS